MREMKDSGIKWIGLIPSAWRTARVKNVAETMQSGGTPDSSNDTFYVDIEGGIPWVAIADMSTIGKLSFTKFPHKTKACGNLTAPTHNCGLLRFDFDEIFKHSLLIQQNLFELVNSLC